MKVLVDYKKLSSFDDCDYGVNLAGVQGFCRVKRDIIQKIYYKKREKKYDFTKYRSSKIAFPINYLYDYRNFSNKYIVGEEMVYFPKREITDSIDSKTKIEDLIRNYYEIVQEIRKYKEISMNDLCSPNILYDSKSGFSLIDTTSWIIDETKDFSEYNIRKLEFELCDILLDSVLFIRESTLTNPIFYHNLMRYGEDGKKLLNALRSTLDDDYQLIDILSLYRFISLKYGLKPIKTLEDMENYTKKLKKG